MKEPSESDIERWRQRCHEIGLVADAREKMREEMARESEAAVVAYRDRCLAAVRKWLAHEYKEQWALDGFEDILESELLSPEETTVLPDQVARV